MTTSAPPSQAAPAGHSPALSLFDERSFFEKALRYGLAHGVIDQQRLEAMEDEGARGMVQIARYFGSEFLRPDLELARERMVNMMSLSLRIRSQGDLGKAAETLRDSTLLSCSKAGSDMLKALIVMPQNSHFGMNERGSFSDRHIGQLARWSLAPFEEYQAELRERDHAVLAVQAALEMGQALGLDQEMLHDAGADADAVIRTALLVSVVQSDSYPDWVALEKLIEGWRKKSATAASLAKTAKALSAKIKVPAGLNLRSNALVEELRDSVIADLPKLLNARTPLRKLLDQTPAFMGRYFWLEDALSDINQLDTERSAAWDKLSKGRSDDATVLTLLLCTCAALAPKPSLTEKTALTLVRRLRKNGLKPELAQQWLQDFAPAHYLADYLALWQNFCDHAGSTLLDEHDKNLRSALRLLRSECNITAS